MHWDHLTPDSKESEDSGDTGHGRTEAAPNSADRVWRDMMRRRPAREPSGGRATPRTAGTAAYAALLQGKGTTPAGNADAGQWLLLRDRTASRHRAARAEQR
ncbi:hypothetical protein ACFYNZ_04960 [Streptomyces kebangsaanensis]|uniref:Uncharacterized protein n=1 Tax=Streptomyces kebangsaanensis TaxID=864058 RepID=A0ABW6KQY7_9ACTN